MLALTYIVYILYKNEYVYEKYFKEYVIVKCIITSKAVNKNYEQTIQYKYKIDGYVYQASYATDIQVNIDVGNKCYCVCSKEDVHYNIFLPVHNIDKANSVTNDSEKMKKYLSKTQKARYLSRNN